MSAARNLTGSPISGETGDSVTLEALLGLVRRRWLAVSATAALAVGAAVALINVLPPRYSAEALLVYEPAAARGAAAGYSPDADVGRQLARISEIVFGRDLLEREIREHRLLAHDRPVIAKAELEAIKARIGIRAQGESTFSISFEDDDAGRVAQVADHLAQALVGTSRDRLVGRARDRTDFLSEQLDPLLEKLRQQEQEIESYKWQWASEMPEQSPTNLRLLEGAQERLLDASSTVAENEARRAAIRRQMSELERQGATTREDPVEGRLAEMRGELAELRNRYTDRHPDVVRLEARIADLEQAMAEGSVQPARQTEPSPVELRYVELSAELEAVEQRLDSGRAQRQALLADSNSYQGRIEAAHHHEAVIETMAGEAAVTREQVQELRDQLQVAKLEQRLSTTDHGAVFRVVEAPRTPSTPVSPNRPRILLMGLIVGVGLGGVVAFAREQLDSSFRNFDELETATGLRVLAGIPVLEKPRARSRAPRTDLPIVEDPNGPAAEQFRMLATRIFRRHGSETASSTLVASALAGEGKTTAAVNLAIAIAEMTGEEVVLVDADVARASAYRFLGVPRANGFAQLLERPDDDPAQHARWRHGVSLLEIGPYSVATRSALASPRGERVFQRLRQRYRHVVVDSPPVLSAPEALLLQTMVDGILLVVRAGSTPRDAVLRACHTLDSSRLVGALLNGASETKVYAYGYLQPAATARSAARERRA